MVSIAKLLKQYSAPMQQPKPILYLDGKVYNLDYDFELIHEQEIELTLTLYNIIGYYVRDVKIEIGGIVLFYGETYASSQSCDDITQILTLTCKPFNAAYSKLPEVSSIAKGDSLQEYIVTGLTHIIENDIVFAEGDTNRQKLDKIAIVENLGDYAEGNNEIRFASAAPQALPLNYILNFQINISTEKKKNEEPKKEQELQLICLLNPFIYAAMLIDFQGVKYIVHKVFIRFSRQTGVLQEIYAYNETYRQYLEYIANKNKTNNGD